MRLQARTWMIISLLLLTAAAVFWHFGDQRRDRLKAAPPVPPTNQSAATAPVGQPFPLMTTALTNSTAKAAPSHPVAAGNRGWQYQLSNTDRKLAELMRQDAALLLQNALIDTASGVPLKVPDSLRATPDHGTYLVQARGSVTDTFRGQIRAAGGTIVSYIPNNAYMVRVDAAGARQLAASPLTQSVNTYEPYFKLDVHLLPLALADKPVEGWLRVTSYPGARDAFAQALLDLGAEIKGETRTPFGPQIVVEAPEDSLTRIARLSSVQLVEKYGPRQPVNDRSRVRVGVNTNAMIGIASHLNLTGLGVLVNINDTGVDETHPALVGRVSYSSAFVPTPPLQDVNGHGTHVAGTIASASSAGLINVTTNVPGSTTNADFHGMAPSANLYWQPIDNRIGSFLVFDEALQEGAAKTNALISNNSWGYPFSQTYDSSAASFDAAVRDALPGVTGEQPMMFVFAAGNSGFGDDTGQNGSAQTISSPATAKNVVTVGAIESMRHITNGVTNFTSRLDTNGVTIITTNVSPGFLGDTDSDNEVASFSSRGNVGIGIEGPNGRFKPDVMAPGTFTISTRSQQFVPPTNSTFITTDTRFTPNQRVQPGQLNQYTVVVPTNAVRLNILTRRNATSPAPFPSLPIYYNANNPPAAIPADFRGNGFVLAINLLPAPAAPTPRYFAVENNTSQPVDYDLVLIIEISNSGGGYVPALFAVNDVLAPWYRYESGTSMAAPVVTGLAALIQEYLTTQTPITNPSPALKKAILINGSRGVGPSYSIQMDNFANDIGWGLVNLTNSLPLALQAGYSASSPVQFIDQSITESLVTGQSSTRDLTVTATGQTAPMHITLVWTDPPGNPVAGVKLVNDLDLVVTNLDTGEVFVGNSVGGPSGASIATPTNVVPTYDIVNNVENVILGEDGQTMSARYSVTVRARRVNVNSRPDFFSATGNDHDVVQDFALVISSGVSNTGGAAFTLSAPTLLLDANPVVVGVTNISPTNAQPLLGQRVGANAPLVYSVTTNGVNNQWSFYIVTNTVSGGTNIAFATFFPPNISRARAQDSDIDLFVSTDSSLTNLNAAAIDGARKSVKRGGSELVVLNNSSAGTVYYVGVKSEDQQGGDFGFFALATADAFSTRDTNGNLIVTAQQVDVPIPDGTSGAPQGAMMFAIAIDDGMPGDIRRIIVTNTLSHELMGDLQGILKSPEGSEVVLNNHNAIGGDFTGLRTIAYDDSMERDQMNLPPTISTHTAGPGSLNDYIAESAFGLWQFTMIDNQTPHVGTNNAFSFRVEPALPTNNVRTNRVIVGDACILDVVNVPVGATNLTVVFTAINGGPVEVYLRRGALPVRGNYNLDKGATLGPGPAQLSLGLTDPRPLSPGLYFLMICNPSPTQPVTVSYQFVIDRAPGPLTRFNYFSTNNTTILDDAVTNATVQVNAFEEIVDVEVGIRVDHGRESDLVFHLVSPQGTRVMLMENRGGTDGNGIGFGYPVTNVFPQSSTGGFQGFTNVINAGTTFGTLVINYQFYAIPDRMTIYYDGVRLVDTGYINGGGQFSVDFGPGTNASITIVMNEGTNPNVNTVWDYTATVIQPSKKLIFTDDTNRTTVPIKYLSPPYVPIVTGCPTNRVAFSEDFETYPRIGFNSGFMGGWQVDRPGVELHWTGLFGSTAFSGSNYLDMNESSPGQISTNIALIPGQVYSLNFAYARNPDSRTIFNYVPQMQVRMGGVVLTNIVANQNNTWPNLGWTTTSLVFTANSPLMLFELDSITPAAPAGVLLDAISIVAQCPPSPDLYVLPEEPLKVLRGQNTVGTWTLEVWDNRLGVPLGLLVDWYVSFLYASSGSAFVPPPPAPLPSISAFSSSTTNPAPHALLTWPTHPKKLYRVEYSGNLSNWQTLTNITATSDVHRVLDPATIRASSNRFYRLVPQ